MRIAREFHGKGWTAEEYERLIAGMNLAGHSAPGVLFHWAAVTDDGVLAVDVYESREAADRLVQTQVGPLAAELGLATPEIREYEVHAVLSPR